MINSSRKKKDERPEKEGLARAMLARHEKKHNSE